MQTVHEKIKLQVDMEPKDDGSLLEKRKELQREVRIILDLLDDFIFPILSLIVDQQHPSSWRIECLRFVGKLCF